MRRLVNLIEFMMKANAKDDAERLRITEQLYEPPVEEEVSSDPRQPPRRRRMSGKEKLARYANKNKPDTAPEVVPEAIPEVSGKPVKKKAPPPGALAMTQAEALAMMESARAEDEELIRGKR